MHYYQTEAFALEKSTNMYFTPDAFTQDTGVCLGFPHSQSLAQNGSKAKLVHNTLQELWCYYWGIIIG